MEYKIYWKKVAENIFVDNICRVYIDSMKMNSLTDWFRNGCFDGHVRTNGDGLEQFSIPC